MYLLNCDNFKTILVILGCVDFLTLGIHCVCLYVHTRLNIIIIIILCQVYLKGGWVRAEGRSGPLDLDR